MRKIFLLFLVLSGVGTVASVIYHVIHFVCSFEGITFDFPLGFGVILYFYLFIVLGFSVLVSRRRPNLFEKHVPRWVSAPTSITTVYAIILLCLHRFNVPFDEGPMAYYAIDPVSALAAFIQMLSFRMVYPKYIDYNHYFQTHTNHHLVLIILCDIYHNGLI